MTTRASFRVFRSGLIGSIILGLAAGGHLAGGGRLAAIRRSCWRSVPWRMVPVAALTRFRLSFPVLAGLIGAGQALASLVLLRAVSRSARRFPGTDAPGPCRTRCGGRCSPGDVRRRHAGHAADSATAPCSPPTPRRPLARPCCWPAASRPCPALASWLRPLVQLPEPVAIVPCASPALHGACVLPRVRLGRRLPTRRGPPELGARRLTLPFHIRTGTAGGPRRFTGRTPRRPFPDRFFLCERHPCHEILPPPYPQDRRGRHDDRRPARRRRRSRLRPRPRRPG